MLKNIQSMLYDEMLRLSQPKVSADEIARSNALSTSATTYLKAINVGIRIFEIQEKNNMTKEQVHKKIGMRLDEE